MGEKLNDIKETASEIKTELKEVKNLTVNGAKFAAKGTFVMIGSLMAVGGFLVPGAGWILSVAGAALAGKSVVSISDQYKQIQDDLKIQEEAARRKEEQKAALSAATSRPQPVVSNPVPNTTIDEEELKKKLARQAKEAQEAQRAQLEQQAKEEQIKILEEANAKLTTPPSVAFTIQKYAKNTNGIPMVSADDYKKIIEELNNQAKHR